MGRSTEEEIREESCPVYYLYHLIRSSEKTCVPIATKKPRLREVVPCAEDHTATERQGQD